MHTQHGIAVHGLEGNPIHSLLYNQIHTATRSNLLSFIIFDHILVIFVTLVAMYGRMRM